MFSRAIGLAAWVVLSISLAFPQGFTATITGTVKDESGAVLQGAVVTAKHTETGLMRSAVTDAGGGYSIPSLPVGAYEITAQEAGFKGEVVRGIELAVAQEAVVNVTLQVGNVEQRVTVTGEAPLVNTTLASTSGLITEQQVKDMPLNGRSFDQLLTLNVGVSNASSNTLNSSTWNMFSVAGKRPETNRFMLNGVDWIGGSATGQFITPYGASGKLLGVEAMREFNVQTDTYGAEYGKRAGGQISVVTNSGTNRVHGSAFEFLRNSALDARDFFDQTIGTPPFKRNQFGGMLGGPIKKDKLFVMGTYEGYRERLARSSASIVPDALARKGLMDDGSPVPGLKPKMLEYANTYWPAPNGPQLGDLKAYSYNNPSQTVNEHFGLARVDYDISAHDSLSGHYTSDYGIRNVPWGGGGGGAPNWAATSELEMQSISLQETHVFSPSLVNVATAGFARGYSTLVNHPAAGVTIPSHLLFLAGGNPGAIVIGGGISAASPSAVAGTPGNNPTTGVRNYFTGSDDLHWTKGKHSWSFGGWIQRMQQGQAGVALSSAGNVAYPTVLAFLQDKPTQAIVTRNAPGLGYRSTEAAWYVQDEIKLRRNLAVRIGLRDEMTNGWNEVAGRCTNYFFDPNFVIQTNPHIGGSCFTQNNAKALWQPRVGIAWDPTGTGTWAVRAGAGIHNDLLDNLGIRAQPNPPFAARENLDLTGKAPGANGVPGFLPLIPLDPRAQLPPTCGPGIPQPCSIYQPAAFDPNLFTPTIQMWTLTVERQLTRDLMLSVAYVGSQSYHTNLTLDTNVAPPKVCQNPQGCVSGGTLAANQRGLVPQGATYMAPGTRPNPYVNYTVSWWDAGTSNYNALNVSLVKRATHGLAFKANYSYSKVMDLNSAILAPSGENEPASLFSPYDRFLNRGVAAYSLRHQFNGNFSYQFPFGNGQRFGGNAVGWMNQLIGGWQWNGIVTAQDGFPMTPVIGFNNSGTGDLGNPDVPNWNPNFHGKVILGTPDQWFDPRAFTVPIPGTFGNVARGALRGPGLVEVDTSLFKKFPINERLNLQLRAEVFNILNHSNFSLANPIVFDGNSASYTYSSSAAQIYQSAASSRQLQLALKLLF
jgi:hypothetical protein